MNSVLQVCAYAASYPGNFINSLTQLEYKLKEKSIDTVYAFAEGAKEQEWCKEIQKRCKVYFLPVAKSRILPRTYSTLKRIYKENNIIIAHSHFELYDIPTTVTAPKNVKIFWHLHDAYQQPQRLSRNILNKLQYGYFSKRATLISISDYYRKEIIKLGFRPENTKVITNGIDLSRIDTSPINRSHAEYTFLTFAWDFYTKGGDIILNVFDRLSNEGYSFNLLFSGNKKSWTILDRLYPAGDPSYLTRIDPVDDVNILFKQSKAIIQASRRETFSYALCEAAYSGMRCFASDIPGLNWAKQLPCVTFFDTENEQAFYEKIKSFLEQPQELTQNDIIETRKIINQKFSTDVWIKNLLNAYEL